ncbi:MAG: hydroxymethylbilane synthase [Lachnospira sp.]|nr:hydroxymethylbilane synthase [Lachnospira sp.]
MRFIIGTRGSKLALTQAEYVRMCLLKNFPEHTFELKIIKTKGDVILDKPLNKIGDKGVFVREIEEQLLSGEIQIGVHSMKDMPSMPAEGLMFTKAWKREDNRDVLILREAGSVEKLPQGAVIGTGSARRALQLRKLRDDIKVVGIRGNVDTRIRKMHEEKLDGIVLAAAGLKRLSMENVITEYLDIDRMVPAPAQGVLALEIKYGNKELEEMLNHLSDEETIFETEAERGFLKEMNADCHTPVGAACIPVEEAFDSNSGQQLHEIKENYKSGNKHKLITVFGKDDNSELIYAEVVGNDPLDMAHKAAKIIKEKGNME